ncbi:MAG TPA: PH domain-containing protein [Acidimicrobiales bacterium]|nr:PH domain-containing protein [Acidimicrobiales bacterium]
MIASGAPDDVWAPPPGGWTGVSPRLGSARRLLLFTVSSPVVLGGVAVAAIFGGAAGAFAALAVFAVVLALLVQVIDRQWRAIGYAERDDDLLVKRGVLFRQLVVVPYGRMQFVDVTGGPLERRFGLATVQLHTAAAVTDAAIPGLVPEEAARLRDRLAALGQARSAGL